ncbi:pentatricopeptide repeat-containing protein At2g19280-like isoform X2 [Phalaenopsis equestris]|uniref:pentatricopeptide repeat-containing protein At2g19280-like isoform X2 n=1 Tax=Phalaenopsis equestris TaxID=78828 RepID=UPI0009E40719|nr:pentatricopeptide repeat-containing protein At2g19280-like isoform X2 [Phalaenopsis equestris]
MPLAPCRLQADVVPHYLPSSLAISISSGSVSFLRYFWLSDIIYRPSTPFSILYALGRFREHRASRVQPSSLLNLQQSVLVDGHCKNDDIQGAENVFNALERDGFKADVTTYNTLINVYSKKGHMHKAYELVDLMRKAGIFPDSVTYNMIMHGLIKRGFAIKTIFNELIRRGYSPDKMYSSDKFTCTNIIHGYSKEGRLGEAYLIWCSMSKRGMAPDVVTCSALLNGFCKMHRMQDADVLFQKMLDAGLVPDLILYNTLVRGFCSVGDISKACQILVMMRASGIFPNDTTHCALIIGFEKNGIENAQESVTMLMQQMFSME